MRQDIEVQSNSVAIVGWHEGAAGQIHSWLETSGIHHIACFVNPTDAPVKLDYSTIHRDAKQFSYPTQRSFKNKPLLNSASWIDVLKGLNIVKVLVTTDDPRSRFEQILQAKERGMTLINAIHPTAHLMEDAILADNIILHARAYVGYRAELHDGVVINVGSQIDHHNVLKECATIDPGVVFAGNVTVGRFARIHTGATVINKIKIGENSIIGAGAVIIKDVPCNTTVVGVPGRIIKERTF